MTDEAVAEGLGGSIHADVIHLAYALLRGDYDRVLAASKYKVTDGWEKFMFFAIRTAALRARGRLDEARQAIDQAANVGLWAMNFSAWASGMLALEQGQVDAAVVAFSPVFAARDPRNLVGCADVSIFAGVVNSLKGRFEDAAVLLGYGVPSAEKLGRGLADVDKQIVEKALVETRQALGDDFEGIYERGAASAWKDLPLDVLETE